MYIKLVALIIYLSSCFLLKAKETIVYDSQDNKSSTQATAYSKTHQCSLRYLAYRDIPFF
jgi:hypothetical protein